MSDVGLRVPREGTILQSNLDYMLQRLTDRRREVQDVLLFLHSDQTVKNVPWRIEGFKVVLHYCEPEGKSRFIEMGPASDGSQNN